MVGIIVISHGDMAKGILSSAGMLFPDNEQLDYLSVQPETNPDEFQENLEKKVSQVDTGDGVVILADLLGGTPCNRAIYTMSNKVHILSGMNLPMLITILLSRKTSNEIDDLIAEAIEAAKEGIVDINKQFNK